MTPGDVERALDRYRGDWTRYDPFMDHRIVMVTQNLDAFVARLVKDGVKFLAFLGDQHARGGHKYSVIVGIPAATAVVEVRGSVLTVLDVGVWNRCNGQQVPSYSVNPHEVSEVYARNERAVLQPVRFVWPSSNPDQAASIHAAAFDGQIYARNSICESSRVVEMQDRDGRNSFEYEWVHWKQVEEDDQRDARLFMHVKDYEAYMAGLRGDISWGTANNWDQHMDNHPGLYVSDCDALLTRLSNADVPFFITHHWRFFLAVYFTDPQGQIYEVDCHNFAQKLERLAYYQGFNFCVRTPNRNITVSSPLAGA